MMTSFVNCLLHYTVLVFTFRWCYTVSGENGQIAGLALRSI